MKGYDLKLLFLFLLLAAAIVLRVHVEATGYTSPDSEYYQEAAGNLLQGRGLTMSNEYPLPQVRTPQNQVPFTAWPVGYPLLIAALSALTSLSVFWASKLVNILCLGGCLLVLRGFNRQKAWLLGLLFCSFTMFEVFSYTWSEGPFLFFMLLLVVRLNAALVQDKTGSWIWLLGAAICLFLIRYIGLFVVPVLGLMAIYFWFRGARGPALKLFSVGFVTGLFILGYFYLNYTRTGSMWGGTRIIEHSETAGRFLFILSRGLMNEFFLIRNHYFRGPVEPLFLLMSGIQLFWMGLFWWHCLRGRTTWKLQQTEFLPGLLYLLGFVYLLMLVVLRLLSPFDAFDYRLLSPFTLLVGTGILYTLLHPGQAIPQRRVQLYLVAFFVLAYLMNLPKEYLLQLVFGKG